jgi:uncharacterized RDD family membrane protein YckC
MKEERGAAIRRLSAFAVDWFVLVLWGSVIFGAMMIATGGNPPKPESPWTGQVMSLLTMTVPFTLYFALCESSAMQASLGKRTLGLVVSRESGGRLSFGSALLRNAVKLTPWEFGHMVAWQSVFAGEAGFPAWVWGPAIIAFVGPVWWLVALIGIGRTLYDRWAFAQVGVLAVHENRSATATEPLNGLESQ